MADSAGLREGVVAADWPVEATAQCARTNSANQRAFEIGFSVTLAVLVPSTICLEVNAGTPCYVVLVQAIIGIIVMRGKCRSVTNRGRYEEWNITRMGLKGWGST